MKPCVGCGTPIDRTEEARYDVLAPGYDALTNADQHGPYCETCWPTTTTGAQIAAAPNPAPWEIAPDDEPTPAPEENTDA